MKKKKKTPGPRAQAEEQIRVMFQMSRKFGTDLISGINRKSGKVVSVAVVARGECAAELLWVLDRMEEYGALDEIELEPEQ